MENKNIENILLDINQKIKNRHTFTWKWWFGWLIFIPFLIVGGLFIKSSYRGYYGIDRNNLYTGVVIMCIGGLFVLKNWIQGLIALYKSTKDLNEVKEFKEQKGILFEDMLIRSYLKKIFDNTCILSGFIAPFWFLFKYRFILYFNIPLIYKFSWLFSLILLSGINIVVFIHHVMKKEFLKFVNKDALVKWMSSPCLFCIIVLFMISGVISLEAMVMSIILVTPICIVRIVKFVKILKLKK